MVVMPSACNRSAVLPPIPGISLHGALANRSHACSRLSTTNPCGFSASEATFATSLFGPMPTDAVSPVCSWISATIRRIPAFGAGSPVSSR